MLTLSSAVFKENGIIPGKYTCDSENVNPPLSISGVPAGAKSLALIMDDPDIPQAVKERFGISVFDHWVVFDIPPETTEISENKKPSNYTGPCPPDREHRYFFRLYALDTMLALPEGAPRAEVEEAMQGHIVESAELVGRYNRPQNRHAD